MRYINQAILYCLFLIFLSCVNHGKKVIKIDLENDSLIKKWNNDTNGCYKTRDFDLAEKIFNNYDFRSRQIEDFIAFFGKPNHIIKDSVSTDLYYYCYSICDYSNHVIDESDKRIVIIRLFKNYNTIEGRLE